MANKFAFLNKHIIKAKPIWKEITDKRGDQIARFHIHYFDPDLAESKNRQANVHKAMDPAELDLLNRLLKDNLNEGEFEKSGSLMAAYLFDLGQVTDWKFDNVEKAPAFTRANFIEFAATDIGQSCVLSLYLLCRSWRVFEPKKADPKIAENEAEKN